MIDLVREGKTLWLSVHLITKPGKLDREHKIVFGLQATPSNRCRKAGGAGLTNTKFPAVVLSVFLWE